MKRWRYCEREGNGGSSAFWFTLARAMFFGSFPFLDKKHCDSQWTRQEKLSSNLSLLLTASNLCSLMYCVYMRFPSLFGAKWNFCESEELSAESGGREWFK